MGGCLATWKKHWPLLVLVWSILLSKYQICRRNTRKWEGSKVLDNMTEEEIGAGTQSCSVNSGNGNNNNNNGTAAATMSRDVYIIPDASTATRPHHLLVLPFVPHPSNPPAAPPPAYVYSQATPIYTENENDPPPDYETLGDLPPPPAGYYVSPGTTHCSCCTQVTNLSEDPGK